MGAPYPAYDPSRMEGLVPEHLRPGLRRYIEDGVRPGDALFAILCNAPAAEVVLRCDELVLPRLADIYRFLHNDCPSQCWGTRSTCEAWVQAHEAAS